MVVKPATNAMLHARTPFLVTVSGCQKWVRLEVLDGAQAGPVQFAAQNDEPNGRGLAIVDALCRGWGITGHTSGGKSVWLSSSCASRAEPTAQLTVRTRPHAGRSATPVGPADPQADLSPVNSAAAHATASRSSAWPSTATRTG